MAYCVFDGWGYSEVELNRDRILAKVATMRITKDSFETLWPNLSFGTAPLSSRLDFARPAPCQRLMCDLR